MTDQEWAEEHGIANSNKAVSVTELRKHLSTILTDVETNRQVYRIERYGKTVAYLVPIGFGGQHD